MAHVHSTVGVNSSRQLLKWQQIMGDVYYRVDIVGDRKHGIRGKLAEQALGGVSLTRFDSDRQRVLRTRAHIASDGDDSYVLVFPETGRCTSSTRGATAMCRPAAMSWQQHYELSCADNFATPPSASRPRRWKASIRAPGRIAPGAARPRRIRRRGPWLRAVGVAAERRVAPAARAGAGLRGGAAGGDPAARRGRRRRRGRRGGRRPARDGLAVPGDRQPDPGLRRRDAAECRAGGAAAAHLAGYVHRILARHATSFGEQLREAHLQQAYEMLADARLNHLTIKEVMYRAGFSNFSHFCYAFRQRFGCTAGELRQRGRARRLLTRSDARRSARRRTNKPCTPTTFPPGGVDILAASDFSQGEHDDTALRSRAGRGIPRPARGPRSSACWNAFAAWPWRTSMCWSNCRTTALAPPGSARRATIPSSSSRARSSTASRTPNGSSSRPAGNNTSGRRCKTDGAGNERKHGETGNEQQHYRL